MQIVDLKRMDGGRRPRRRRRSLEFQGTEGGGRDGKLIDRGRFRASFVSLASPFSRREECGVPTRVSNTLNSSKIFTADRSSRFKYSSFFFSGKVKKGPNQSTVVWAINFKYEVGSYLEAGWRPQVASKHLFLCFGL